MTENAAPDRRLVLNFFYYLAPLWFLAETFIWPNFRAGVVFGDSAAGAAAFYAAEWGIGFALWRRLRYADLTALLENVAYLILALKYVLYAPLDAASALASDLPVAADFSASYAASLPGIMYSVLHVVLRIKDNIQNLRPGIK